MAIDGELPPRLKRLHQKVANDPESKAFVGLADLYLQDDLLEEALDVLSTGIRHHPTYVAARMMRGKIYLKTKRLREAKDDFEAVLAAHPEHIQAYRNLAQIYREIGKLGEAVTMCNKILAIDQNDNSAKSLLTAIHNEIGTTEEIHSLAPSLTSKAAPDTLSEEELLSAEEGSYPTGAWNSNGAERARAVNALAALNQGRLQTWLISIEKRKKAR